MDYEVTRVSAWSVFKITAAIYVVIGVALGLIFGLVGFRGGGPWLFIGGPVVAVLSGLVYGIFAGAISALAAAIYNVAARVVGGIRMELGE